MGSRKGIDWIAAYHAARETAKEPNLTPEQRKHWLELAESYRKKAGYSVPSDS